jgi:hypothetical protein
MHLMGAYLAGVCLMGVHLIGVHLSRAGCLEVPALYFCLLVPRVQATVSHNHEED